MSSKSNYHTLHYGVNVLNKESVELTSVYLTRGSDKTLKRINDYKTPHLDSMG